jgi:hypothetical protein
MLLVHSTTSYYLKDHPSGPGEAVAEDEDAAESPVEDGAAAGGGQRHRRRLDVQITARARHAFI